jgi:hypothetical protein
MFIAIRKNTRITKKILSWVLSVTVVLSMSFFLVGNDKAYAASAPVPTSFYDAITAVTTMNLTSGVRTWINTAAYAAKQKVVEQPIQGYFIHNFPGTAVVPAADQTAAVAALAGREWQIYIPKHAPQRTYVTVIAVPNGVQANEFLYEQGWFDVADAYGEILCILLPGPGGWGTPEAEKLYINAVVGMSNRLDENGQVISTTNGIFGIRQPNIYLLETISGVTKVTTFAAFGNIYIPLYFVGYGEACAPLEAHTSYVPENVIAQAFIGGTSAGSAILAQSAKRIHAGFNNGLFNVGYADDVFKKQLQSIIDSYNPYIGGQRVTTDFITNADIPVPTLLAGTSAANPSLDYWKSVNHTVGTADLNGAYRERIDNGSWATHYANENIKRWNPSALYGVSKVQTTNNANMTAVQIRDFLAEFSRMNNFTANSDSLSYRVPYQELHVTARAYDDQNATISTTPFTRLDSTQGQVELRAHESKFVTVPQGGPNGGGTLHFALFAYEDRDAATVTNGTLDGRDVTIYVPDSAKVNKPVPMIIGIPGTQNGSIQYFGQTQWWAVAKDEGFVAVIFGQDYANRTSATGNPQGITEGGGTSGANYVLALEALIKSGALDLGVQIDWGRFYGSGFSAGASAINSIVINGTNRLDGHFAALYNQSIAGPLNSIPTSNLMPTLFTIASPEGTSLLAEPWANSVVDTASGSSIITAPAQAGTYNSVRYLNAMNGVQFNFAATSDLEASRQSYIDNVKALGGNFWQYGRYINTTFLNWQKIDLVGFTRVLGREHNPTPEEPRYAWKYLSRFRIDPGTNHRFFSPSAFKETGDEIIIVKEKQEIQSVEVKKVFVDKLTGDNNNLTISVAEKYPGIDGIGYEVVFTATHSIHNNAAGTYDVGPYKVYVDTKGNTQIRACYIVK